MKIACSVIYENIYRIHCALNLVYISLSEFFFNVKYSGRSLQTRGIEIGCSIILSSDTRDVQVSGFP